MSIINEEKKIKRSSKHFKIGHLSITSRVAILLFAVVLLPMVFTGFLIEQGRLLPGKNIYLAIPIFFVFILFPFSRLIAHFLINKDLTVIDRVCTEIKKGNYPTGFAPDFQRENEEPFIILLRNLSWMSHNLSAKEKNQSYRLKKISQDLGEMERKAITDPLTGLFNRHYLNGLADYFTRSKQYIELSIIYIDCDQFKQVNDTKGHATGDELLVWLAKCINDNCRLDHDIAIRLGGDEFLLLLPDTDGEQAQVVCNRIRTLYHHEYVHNTTLSMGIAYSSIKTINNQTTLNRLIESADRQAYIAKQSGGDYICYGNELKNLNNPPELLCKNSSNYCELANYDPLTGIPNRYLAKERFERATKRSKRSGIKFCVMFLDLDDFKTINDSLGHDAGDKFLKHIAQTLKNTLRAEDTVCRLGGDEFLILTEKIEDKEAVSALAVKVIESVRQPVTINKHEITVTSSLGIALVPDNGDEFDDLCKRADMALFEAKEQGRNNFCFFNPSMAVSVNEALELTTDLRSAIESGQLELYFQPQVDLSSGAIVAVESLIRWNHPEKGILSPATFIPIAERSGLIMEIGEWVIYEACKKCSEWGRLKGVDLVIAINISPIQISRGKIAETVLDAITKYQIKGSNIDLEFTESLLLHNNKRIKEELNLLRKNGVHLSIDDFGTGYSNLSYLKHFDITKIKIDRSFIFSMSTNRQDQAIVQAIIHMAKSLNIDTVAEGIEDLSTMELLTKMGCEIGQGYHWSKPLQEDYFLTYYQNSSTRKAA